MYSGCGFKNISLVILIGVFLCLDVFVYTRRDHDCAGGDCPICLFLQGLQNPPGHLRLTGVFARALGSTMPFQDIPAVRTITAVDLKVRLNA
ncbi:MAG: hypothetical protein LBG73_08260 [Spirochaetaceae bacterium]|jgi:hypothetical protein|nr:hypothetical protein [Spirochaetaceae bacterium]